MRRRGGHASPRRAERGRAEPNGCRAVRCSPLCRACCWATRRPTSRRTPRRAPSASTTSWATRERRGHGRGGNRRRSGAGWWARASRASLSAQRSGRVSPTCAAKRGSRRRRAPGGSEPARFASRSGTRGGKTMSLVFGTDSLVLTPSPALLFQMGHPLLPSAGLHTRLHHGAGPGGQAGTRVQQTQREDDRPLH